jgi:hypothetical protein
METSGVFTEIQMPVTPEWVYPSLYHQKKKKGPTDREDEKNNKHKKMIIAHSK